MSASKNKAADGARQNAGALPLGETQRGQPVPAQWNATAQDYPRDVTLYEMFESQVDRTPDAVAVAFEGATLSYRELDERANQLARYLQTLGVGPDVRVGVFAERSLELVIALYGVLKAGGAYVPLDPGYPLDRLTFMVEDADVPVLLTQSHLVERLPQHTAQVLCLDADWAKIGKGKKTRLGRTSGPHDLAYVIFTSGSTGRPKGAMNEHTAVVNRLVWMQAAYQMNATDVVLQKTPFSFDVSVWEFFWPLQVGARMLVARPEGHKDPAYLMDVIQSAGITTLHFVPSMLAVFLEADGVEACKSIKRVVTSGEALAPAHVDRCFERLPQAGLYNLYGPTEAAIDVTHWTARPGSRIVPIGQPIANTQIYIVDAQGQQTPVGVEGELWIGGVGVGRGYLNRPDLTAEKFIANPFAEGRVYRTGDLARWQTDGQIEYLGRIDHQVKIRGFRIELGEIEAVLASYAGVREAAVLAREDTAGDKRLVAYVVAREGLDVDALKAHAAAALPEYMVPSAVMVLDVMPVSPNGKLDRKALPAPSRKRPQLAEPFVPPQGKTEEALCSIFQQVLGLDDQPGINDNFFELGGSSLMAVQAVAKAKSQHGLNIPIVRFFQSPTVSGLAREMGGSAPLVKQKRQAGGGEMEPIAIVGMATRFPGADDVGSFWDNLFNGVESVRHFAPHELDPGLPKSLTSDPRYVPVRGVLDDVDKFDAAYFGIAPYEAALIDPQQRLLLELCVHALEHAGHAPHTFLPHETVGVFAGTHVNSYYLENVRKNPEALERAGDVSSMLANEKDYVATRVAYRLALTGPAVSVHTACSTSLVAVIQGFYALRNRQCDYALAGGVSLTVPTNSGHLFQDGSALSSDGHTRPFSQSSSGTTFSDGGGVVVLRRLSDAQRDGDTIYAVVKGGAINNDGGDRPSFTAPSVSGQAAVILAAQDAAGVDARSISYVEAHGTATPLGDPIEVEALRQAFGASTSDTQFCGIGSVKSNFGHVTVAAGAAGLIKAALALHHEVIPKTLHYDAPNPAIDFTKTPFFVDHSNRAWKRGDLPRRAGVSSFGFGGTNAHVVIEEAPPDTPAPHVDGEELLVFSARSKTSLVQHTAQVRKYLQADHAPALDDAAFTLQLGRRAYAERSFAVVGCKADLADDKLFFTKTAAARARGVAFMFPGQGAQYVGMGRSLYQREPVFRAIFDEANSIISAKLGRSLKDVMFAQAGEAAEKELQNTVFTQSALFTLQYSLASLWMHWGIQPVAMIGHSIGEFAAAAIAGVFSLEDALALVAARGQLMQAQPAGTMLSVRLPVDRLAPRLPSGMSVATVNSPDLCVVGGPTPDVLALQQALEREGVLAKVLVTSHAFHSPMMEPAVAPFLDVVKRVKLHAPRFRIMSTSRATWLSDELAQDPNYWARHMRDTVRFSDGMFALLKDTPGVSLLEVGPRGTLATLARQHMVKKRGDGVDATPDERLVASSFSDAPDKEWRSLLTALGQLWASGETMDWRAFQGVQGQVGKPSRRRVALPGYVFERKSFWIAPSVSASLSSTASKPAVAAPARLNSHAVAIALPATSPAPDAIPAIAPQEESVVSDRKSELTASLTTLIEDTSGLELAGADPNTTFFELGIDSLLLTQIAMSVSRQFKINVTFRQLSENFSSLALLVNHLDSQLPQSTVPVLAAVPAAAPAAFAAVAAVAPPQATGPVLGLGSNINIAQTLIAEQLRVMQQQLAVLSGAGYALAQTAQAPTQTVAAAPVHAPVSASLAAAAPEPVVAKTADEDLAHTKYDVKKAFGAIARIHTQSKELSERQKMRLDAFMRRYSERTAKSKAFTDANRSHMADPRVVNGFRPALKEITYQIVVERSKGAYMWDIDGNQYVDVLNGFGMNMFGWQPDFVQEAVRRQLDLGYEIGPQHPLAAEVTSMLCDMTGFDRAGLCNTGSEAVMAAMRIARTVSGRNTIVTFSGDYHGTFDEVLVRAGRNAKGLSAAPGVMSGMFGDIRVLDYGTPEALAFVREHANDIAAVLVEPVQSRRPDFQPREFLKELRAITEQADVCLIFDEVITGFRSHLGGAQALFGVRADLVTYGKVIGGGFPVGAVAGTRKYMDALDGGAWRFGDDSIPSVGVTYFAGTFVRHPLALAACKASMEFLKKDNGALQARLNQYTAAMADELTAFCRSVGAPIEIRHFASLWRVAWLEDHPYQDLLFAMMRSRGVHILDNFPCYMTMAHTRDDIALIEKAFKESVAELQEAGFLPAAKQVASAFDASKPPVPGARLGRDPSGVPAWFAPNPQEPGKYIKVEQTA